jgi:LPS-assembly lipoprotein
MSSADPRGLPSPLAGEGQGRGKAARHNAAPILLTLVLAFALAACQIRPLYSSNPAAPGPQADLPAILIDEPVTREEQVYRNALLFALQGGSGDASARYELIYRLTIREQEIAVERETGTPNAYQLTGGLSFLVKEIATGRSLFGASVTGIDSYTRSSQNFANVRARRDAEDRLAETLAELTQTRLAAYFATH